VRGGACSTSAIRIEFVTIVSPSTARSACASANVVVPADSPTAVPGETSSTAARAIASFSGCWRDDFASNPGSSVLADLVRVAPPCTLSSKPCCASASRSRRIVMSDTPSICANSMTRTAPRRWISSTIRACLSAASIASPSW
jgi:hypothetical protein